MPYQLTIHFYMIYSISAQSRSVTILCKRGLTESTRGLCYTWILSSMTEMRVS
jgi:hypothetical protein